MLSTTRFLRSSTVQHHLLRRQHKHTVRVILTQDVGENQSGEVMHVSAGYARNLLIPKKKALYAIADNFERLGKTDPDIETAEERKQRLAQEAADEANVDLIASNLLQKYLRNKMVKIWRNVDSETNTVHPGMVDQKVVRDKLSKQLKIDLGDDDLVHIQETPVESHDNITEEDLEIMMEGMDSSNPCQVQLRQLGMFVAKLSLAGGYTVPLKFVVVKR
mmetsp:Transcript_16669/g.27631  ORF Transcript_16669/g.27631 Transcript_16669/m.27631 type:complete len:219 (+) Transcript_16669:165-821(+)|eukprot:CAMPEP_0119008376 /NCGR_PEP_ID=MMETSP1176-20130426/3648_1 /TAXON_ID=265551 /ORGANISM="Synedropsis recta cf, Strain CCMP1620" /LENGTH=218 /DNA_ID=CAMNT_0006960693 /DNA_START=131 /DNA_END=787 /DNA_ORIENTATION=-